MLNWLVVDKKKKKHEIRFVHSLSRDIFSRSQRGEKKGRREGMKSDWW